jgi:hypothetical protein
MLQHFGIWNIKKWDNLGVFFVDDTNYMNPYVVIHRGIHMVF